MSTAYDPHGVPQPRQKPLDPLLNHPDHPSGVWATPPDWPELPDIDEQAFKRESPRIGHPQPARAGYAHPPALPGSGEFPVVAAPGAEPAVLNNRGRPRLFTILIVIVLVLVAGWQAYRLDQLGRDNDRLVSAMATEQQKSTELTDRAEKIEQRLAGVFDPASVSSAVLPSVFRVRADNLTGTAFVVGDKGGAAANLFTNYHVVREVWEAGDKKVTLERGKDSQSATIVKVNKGKDLALLRADKSIKGLTTAGETVRPGQQIVVVGAPLGLDDSVTTGVVSAYRQDAQDGPTIQFDAPINPGNSGGPVVDAQERVVGLATAKARDAEGIGLAIPIKVACDAFANIC
jgi:putative serine protease PepD